MKIHPKLKWLEPYLLELIQHLPNINFNKLKEITILKSTPKSLTFGYCVKRNNKFIIQCALYYNRGIRYNYQFPLPKLDALVTFSHELAHFISISQTNDWEHTPKHKQWECLITSIFMHILNKEGYISEEVENKNYIQQRKKNVRK